MDDPDIAAALAAERATLSREVRSDPVLLDAYLAPEFHEFGASGGELWREGTAARAAADTTADTPEIRIEGLTGIRVASGVVLVTYTSDNGGRRANRSSLWRRTDDGRWLMLHHQGTPTT